MSYTRYRYRQRKENLVCFFFNTKEGCKNGDLCPYLHPKTKKIPIEKKKVPIGGSGSKKFILNRQKVIKKEKDKQKKHFTKLAKKQKFYTPNSDLSILAVTEQLNRNDLIPYREYKIPKNVIPILHSQSIHYTYPTHPLISNSKIIIENEKIFSYDYVTRSHRFVIRKTRKVVPNGAITRLLNDFLEVQKNFTQNVSCHPIDLEENIFTWHCNVIGNTGTPYEGVIFHFILSFPENYPLGPPSIQMVTPIGHMCLREKESWNARAEKVCNLIELNLYSQNINSWQSRYIGGWSSSFSVMTIMKSLSMFILDDCSKKKNFKNLEKIKSDCEFANKFVCGKCNHNALKKCYWPWGGHMNEYLNVNKSEKMNKESLNDVKRKYKLLEVLPAEVIEFEIFKFLSKIDLFRLRKVCLSWFKIAIKKVNFRRDALKCFYSKIKYNNISGCILGFGINLKFNPFLDYFQLDYVELVTRDYVSFYAFDVLQVSADENGRGFSAFLPLWINEKHGKRAYSLFKYLVMSYFNNGEYFNPLDGLDLLMKTMNTVVIRVFNSKIKLTERCLMQYFHIYRMVLELCIEYPFVIEAVDGRIHRFISKRTDEFRLKKNESNIGNFIQLLSVSTVPWNDVICILLSEQWDRNVLWTIKKYNEIVYNIDEERRLLLSFDASMLPSQMLMFNYAFQNMVRPQGNDLTLKELAEKLDDYYGHPPEYIQKLLAKEIKKIMRVTSWDGFFQYIKVNPLKSINETLCDSVVNSLIKKYHDPKMYKRRHYESRKSKSWSPWLEGRFRVLNKEESKLVKKISMLKRIDRKKMSLLDEVYFGTVYNEVRFVLGKKKKKRRKKAKRKKKKKKKE